MIIISDTKHYLFDLFFLLCTKKNVFHRTGWRICPRTPLRFLYHFILFKTWTTMLDAITKFSPSHSCVLLLIYCTSCVWFLKSNLKVNRYSICLCRKFINYLCPDRRPSPQVIICIGFFYSCPGRWAWARVIICVICVGFFTCAQAQVIKCAGFFFVIFFLR